MLAVNGHDRAGKAAGYKQTRCINLAKRGMIVLNVEWLGMGQLNLPANAHGTMDQLNLCGTSGLSLFYLNMTRGMDVLLGHPNADPKRVAVSGLSGGGWQTITVSGLDPRVTLSNPVAGYSSFRTRIQHFKDLGDSAQTPCDLATLVDYTHLTAMRAPRPTLLTFNAKDNCCFESGYALPPLERASRPVFKLFGKEDSLRTHVNHVPGDHNFGQENREALYQMIGDHFFPTDKAWSSKEVLCEKELKTPTELNVELPKDNLTINAVALKLAEKLPRAAEGESVAARRAALAEILRLPKLTAKLEKEKSTLGSVYRVGPWSVPGVEFVKPLGAKRTTIVIADAGKKSVADQVAELRKGDTHVLALDLYYFGECHPASHDWLWSLMLATVGDRALGLQVSQLNAIATLVGGNVTVVAVGPRTSTIALAAAVVDEKAIAALELHEPHRSLREILVENRVVAKTPELFCFGLLERFDVAGLTALVAPRPVKTLDRPKK